MLPSLIINRAPRQAKLAPSTRMTGTDDSVNFRVGQEELSGPRKAEFAPASVTGAIEEGQMTRVGGQSTE